MAADKTKGTNELELLVNPIYKVGDPGRNRTCDTRIRNPVLYPLSYRAGVFEELAGIKPKFIFLATAFWSS